MSRLGARRTMLFSGAGGRALSQNDWYRKDIERARGKAWAIYAELKAFKLNHETAQKEALGKRCDAIFIQKIRYITLTLLLKRLHLNKYKLLLVIQPLEEPLHSNGSDG